MTINGLHQFVPYRHDPDAHKVAAVRARLAALTPDQAHTAEIMREDDLLRHIRSEIADHTFGRLGCYHTHRSDRSEPGWLDLVIAGNGWLVIPELKTETGKVTDEQRTWAEALSAANVQVFIWRPSDWVSGRIPSYLRRMAATLRPGAHHVLWLTAWHGSDQPAKPTQRGKQPARGARPAASRPGGLAADGPGTWPW